MQINLVMFSRMSRACFKVEDVHVLEQITIIEKPFYLVPLQIELTLLLFFRLSYYVFWYFMGIKVNYQIL